MRLGLGNDKLHKASNLGALPHKQSTPSSSFYRKLYWILEALIRIVGKKYSYTILHMARQAMIYLDSNRLTEAEDMMEYALKLYKETSVRDTAVLVEFLTLAAYIARVNEGPTSTVKSYLDKALELNSLIREQDDPTTLQVMTARAKISSLNECGKEVVSGVDPGAQIFGKDEAEIARETGDVRWLAGVAVEEYVTVL